MDTSIAGLDAKMEKSIAQTRIWTLTLIGGFAMNFLAHALKWI